MTASPSDPSDPRRRSGRARRTPPTIDLTATEVRAPEPDPVPTTPDRDPVETAADAIPVATPEVGEGKPAVEAPATRPDTKVRAEGEPRSTQDSGPRDPSDSPHRHSGAAQRNREPTTKEAALNAGSGFAPAAPPGPTEEVAPAGTQPREAPSPVTSADAAALSLNEAEGGAREPSGPRARPSEVPSPERAGSGAADRPSERPAASATPPRTPHLPRHEPPAPAQRSLLAPLAAAGLIGGVVGAGLAYLLGQGQAPDTAPLERRLAAVEERARTPAGASPATEAVQALERRLATLEREQAGLVERLATVQQTAEAGAAQARQALERPAPAAPPATPAAREPDPAVAELRTRLDAVAAEIQRTAAALATVSALEGTVAEQGRRLDEVARTAERSPAVAALEQRLQGQEQRLQGQDQRLQNQDQRIASVAAETERAPQARAATLRVALASRVSDAVREGAPLKPLIDALTLVKADPARIGALQPYAESGAPSAAALLAEFRPLADRLRQEAKAAEPGGVTDRLWRMADNLVQVRPVGEPTGTDLDSVLARIEGALERGALADAANDFDSLPDPARRSAEAFGTRLKQRVAAETAARTLTTEALAALDTAIR